MSTTMTKAEIVERMLEELNSPEKWCKFVLNQAVDGVESMCLMGALNKVVNGDPGSWCIHNTNDPVIDSLVREMDAVACQKNPSIDSPMLSHPTVCFNNNPKTEYEDMRLFLKEVLERVA